MFLFSKVKDILECVCVKYLRSLSSHVYRFISKWQKRNHTSRKEVNSVDEGSVVRAGNCTGNKGVSCVRHKKAQPSLLGTASGSPQLFGVTKWAFTWQVLGLVVFEFTLQIWGTEESKVRDVTGDVLLESVGSGCWSCFHGSLLL